MSRPARGMSGRRKEAGVSESQCTAQHAGVRCTQPATHLALCRLCQPFAWLVWSGPWPVQASPDVTVWQETVPEFCLRCAMDVCEARTKRHVPKDGGEGDRGF